MRFMTCSLILGGSLFVVFLGSAQQAPPQAPAMEPSESMRLVDSTKGPALFTAYCSVCHGWEGKGDGPMAKSLKVAPPVG